MYNTAEYFISQGEFECELYVQGDLKQVVARGHAYNIPDDVMHNVPLPQDTLRVRINICNCDDAILPIPSLDDETLVVDVVGGFVAWPTHLIRVYDKVPIHYNVSISFANLKHIFLV